MLRLPPQTSTELTVPVSVELYENWKPAEGLVEFRLNNLTLTYPVREKATVLLPPDALNATMKMLVIEKDRSCEVALPPLLTALNNEQVISSIAAQPGDGTCYVYKIVVLEKRGYFERLANANVTVDGKKLEVKGSLILVYDKPALEVKLGGQSLRASAGGTVYLYVRPEERVERNATVTAPSVALSLANVTERWNPVGELPGILSLSAGMLLALGVMNSVEPSTPLYAAAYAVASLSFLLGLVTATMVLLKYFSTG